MPVDGGTVRRYLLGEATEAEAEALERAYLANEERLESVVEAEDALIGEYLAGHLPPAERGRFENHYLASPVHRRRVALLRALADRRRPRRAVWFAPWMAAAAALLVTVLGGLWWYRGLAPAGDGVVAVTLPALHLRAEGETPTARLDSGVRTLALRFAADGVQATPPYEALVRTPDGETRWRGPAAAATGSREGSPRIIASAEIPAPSLPAGDYVVVLSTLDEAQPGEVQRYYLRVVRE